MDAQLAKILLKRHRLLAMARQLALRLKNRSQIVDRALMERDKVYWLNSCVSISFWVRLDRWKRTGYHAGPAKVDVPVYDCFTFGGPFDG